MAIALNITRESLRTIGLGSREKWGIWGFQQLVPAALPGSLCTGRDLGRPDQGCCRMKAMLGTEMSPEVALLGTKKNIVF